MPPTVTDNVGGKSTVTTKLSVVLKGGMPLSVARTMKKFVLGVCRGKGVQANVPLAEFRMALVGDPGSRL